MSSSSNIHSLPEEVLLAIFSYLSPTFLCETVSQVCRHWEDLSKDPLLYKTLEFKGGEATTETIVNLLRRAPLLKELRIVGQKHLNKILEQVWQYNHQIRVLDLDRSGSYSEPTRIKLSIMKEITQNCRDIHTFKLKGYYACGDEFYKSLVGLPHLRTVHLINGSKQSYRAVPHLLNSSLGLEDLQLHEEPTIKITTPLCTLSDKEVIALCERFSKTLRCLTIRNSDWTLAAFNALRKCGHLKELTIFQPRIMSSEGLLVLGSMPSLCKLELYCCFEPDNFWIRWFASATWTNLVSLKLVGCSVTCSVAEAIGLHLKNLRTIWISRCHGDVNFKVLETIIKVCPHLQELWFYDPAKKGGTKAILFIPEYIPGLKKLIICTGTKRYWKSVCKIKKLMPELKIEYEE